MLEAPVIRSVRIAQVCAEVPAIRVTHVRAEVPAIRVTHVCAEVPAIRIACIRAEVRVVRITIVNAVVVGPPRVDVVIRTQRPVRVPPRRRARCISVRVCVVVGGVRGGVHRRRTVILSRRGIDGSRVAVRSCQGVVRQGRVGHHRLLRPGLRGQSLRGQCGCGLRGQQLRLGLLRLGRGQLPLALVGELAGQLERADDRLPLVNDRYRLAVGVLGRRLLPACELAKIPRLRPGRHRKRRRQLIQRHLAVAVVRFDKSNGAVVDHLRARWRVLRIGIGCGGGGLSRRGWRINACVAALASLAWRRQRHQAAQGQDREDSYFRHGVPPMASMNILPCACWTRT